MNKKVLFSSLIIIVLLGIGCTALAADTTFKWYPRLGNVMTDKVEIVYLTNQKVATYVQFALKADFLANKGFSDKTQSVEGTLFRIKLTNLKANNQYVYQVVVDGIPATEVYSFYTAPDQPVEFTFLAYGDTRTHQEKHKLLADQMAQDENNPRFVLHVGDLVDNGKQSDLWLDFAVAIKELGASMPYYAAIGNHEYFAEHYYNNLALPQNGGGQFNSEWYSFDYAGVHFIVLDTNILDKYVNEYVPNAVEKQYEWLIKDLEAHQDIKWIIAVFHHPIYSSHERSRYPRLQQELIPIFDKYGVDLVINGHNHIYERVLSGERNYITSGAGGAPFDYVFEYQPRLEESVVIEDAILEYTRVLVTADKLFVEVVQTHEELNDMATLKANPKIIDSVVIENIVPVK